MKVIENVVIETKEVKIAENASFKVLIEEEYLAIDNLGLVWAFVDRPVPNFGMWESEKRGRYLGQVVLEENEIWYNMLFVV